jgi:hypothetical protein
MFGMFSGTPDYEKIFSSKEETYKFIYGDRSKTSTILGDTAFLNAWLSSKNQGHVTNTIQNEAMNGDNPFT